MTETILDLLRDVVDLACRLEDAIECSGDQLPPLCAAHVAVDLNSIVSDLERVAQHVDGALEGDSPGLAHGIRR